ncbi:MAG TPA: NUDIX domain-containing protein [bacterium]|nr:NUDIX domain-containing protein [bacterium]HPN67589.1 NUDIX domain-containing protein [bacterium]
MKKVVELIDAAICFVYNSSGQVLIGKKRFGLEQGQIVFPGGKMEVNELPSACCVREVLEETGIFLAQIKPKHIVKMYRIHLGQIIICHVFESSSFIGKIQDESHELSDIYFADIDQLPIEKMAPEIGLVYPELFSSKRHYYEFCYANETLVIKTKSELFSL